MGFFVLGIFVLQTKLAVWVNSDSLDVVDIIAIRSWVFVVAMGWVTMMEWVLSSVGVGNGIIVGSVVVVEWILQV